MSNLKVADLFAGVGGLSQGFISKGFEIEFAIEYDKDIANSYQLNHPKTIHRTFLFTAISIIIKILRRAN